MNPGSDDFLALYRGQATALLVFFERRVDDPELATNLLSETFVRALEHRTEFRGDTDADLRSWIWAIARSTLAEHQRRVADEARGAIPIGRARRRLTAEEADRIEEIAGRERLRLAARRRLSQLPAEEREVVRLRVVESLPYHEVAARLDLTEEAVRARLWRALHRLATELEGEWPA